MEPKSIALPISIVDKTDVVRMQRELNKLDDFYVAAAARKAGVSIQAPRIMHMLDQTARDNKINLLEAGQRKQLNDALTAIVNQAPSLNISFASEPSPKSLEQILTWFRTNIHPQTLLQVGLQPNIAAGCVLRTPNQVFDMSLRAHFKEQEPYLAKLIGGVASGN